MAVSSQWTLTAAARVLEDQQWAVVLDVDTQLPVRVALFSSPLAYLAHQFAQINPHWYLGEPDDDDDELNPTVIWTAHSTGGTQSTVPPPCAACGSPRSHHNLAGQHDFCKGYTPKPFKGIHGIDRWGHILRHEDT